MATNTVEQRLGMGGGNLEHMGTRRASFWGIFETFVAFVISFHLRYQCIIPAVYQITSGTMVSCICFSGCFAADQRRLLSFLHSL
jgi:hypothetical protein